MGCQLRGFSDLRMTKLQTFKLTNKAEVLKSLGTPFKLLKTLLHATDKTIYYSDMSTMLHICMHGNCMAVSYNKQYGPAHWAYKSL